MRNHGATSRIYVPYDQDQPPGGAMPDIEYSFGTGESAPNVHHSEANVDVDGDGTADGVALDFDGDGRVDDVMWDSDGDGVADTALLDENDDGVAEDAYSDPTGQGTWNAHGQGGNAQQPEAQPTPQPSPGPTGGPDQTDTPNPGENDTDSDDTDGDDTDNGYEPYGADDEDDGASPADEGLPGGDGTDEHHSPGMPGTDEDDTGADDTSGGYEPRDEDAGDATELFDSLEDAPDVDRDSISGWY